MNRRLSCSLLACACVLLAARASFGLTISPVTRITEVTVYSDRADVRREASGVALEPGENRVRFEHLPPTLLTESVRASGSGAEGVRIVNVDLQRVDLGGVEAAHPRAEELASLRAELGRLEARKAALDAGEGQREYLRHRARHVVQGRAH